MIHGLGVLGGGTVAWIAGGISFEFVLAVIVLDSLLAPKGKGRSGGFAGGRMPLGPDPRSQADFFAVSSLHFFMKVRKSARLSLGMFSLMTWLAFR